MSEAESGRVTEPTEPTGAGSANTAPRASAKAKPRSRSSDEPESIGSIVRTVTSALFIAILVRIFIFELFEIDGPSMERTLLNEDRVFVLKYSYGLWMPGMTHSLVHWGHPSAGDVIIFNSPADDQDLVKRVIGLPGDTVEVREGIVYVNDRPIPQRDVGACGDNEQLQPEVGCHIYEERHGGHVYRTTRSGFGRDTIMPTRVPAEHIFVLGDHRDHSNDSREPLVGTIPYSRLKGKAVRVLTSGSFLRGEVRWDRFFQSVD